MSKSNKEILLNGIIKENPVFVLLLGLCPTLGVTSSSINGMAMGLATLVVILFSNMLISMVKSLIPDKVRIPAFIMIIASLVTIVEMVMKAYLPDLYKVLGLFIPLIVVNCIVLGRAESFASKNTVFKSILDGIGSGLGFTLALTVLGTIREILGNGTAFGILVTPESFTPALIFILAPGAFITIGFIIAAQNYFKAKKNGVK
ncbi:MAG: RnfABCDGE type electron transport complex subunit E [Cetobacterium sp.]